MPKFTYTAHKGIEQSSGSGFIVEDVAIAPSKTSVTCAVISAGSPSSGAEEVLLLTTSATGTHGVSLDDGTVVGQMKYIICAALGGQGDLVVKNAAANVDIIAQATYTAGALVGVCIWNGTAWTKIT
jgi:hypothetical protein